MTTYTQIIYQIVFGTKHRRRTLHKENRDVLFQYITGILKGKNCHVYRINGVEDHIHIVTHVHPSIALSNLVKDIKLASTVYIKENHLFPEFTGWQEGYGAFTYSIRETERLIQYVMNQEEHHKTQTHRNEYIKLLNDNGVDFDEKYLL